MESALLALSQFFSPAINSTSNTITSALKAIEDSNPFKEKTYSFGSRGKKETAQPEVSISSSSSPDSQFSYSMGQKDYKFTRPQIERLLKEKQSPLLPYLDSFVTAGERYGVDPRVLVSIANNESSLGKRYPEDSYNPFGYVVKTDPTETPAPEGVDREKQIWRYLKNAGFTSMDHAIDRLTNRFQRQPTEGYKKFYTEPTFDNLQRAYNANDAERENYLKMLNELVPYFK